MRPQYNSVSVDFTKFYLIKYFFYSVILVPAMLTASPIDDTFKSKWLEKFDPNLSLVNNVEIMNNLGADCEVDHRKVSAECFSEIGKITVYGLVAGVSRLFTPLSEIDVTQKVQLLKVVKSIEGQMAKLDYEFSDVSGLMYIWTTSDRRILLSKAGLEIAAAY